MPYLKPSHVYFSFNPRANTRAPSRSSSFGLPLFIPPKSFKGPTVSHPLQENSPVTEKPRFTSISFRAACPGPSRPPLVEKIKPCLPVTAGSPSVSYTHLTLPTKRIV